MHKPVKEWTEEQEGRQYRMTLYRISSGGKQFHVVNRRAGWFLRRQQNETMRGFVKLCGGVCSRTPVMRGLNPVEEKSREARGMKGGSQLIVAMQPYGNLLKIYWQNFLA